MDFSLELAFGEILRKLDARSERRWAALEQRAEDFRIGAPKQIDAEVFADNLGGLERCSSPPGVEQFDATQAVVADNWGGLFNDVPDEPVPALDSTSFDLDAPDYNFASPDSDAHPFVIALNAAHTEEVEAEEVPLQMQEREELVVDEKVLPSTGGEVLKVSALDRSFLVQGALSTQLPPRQAPLRRPQFSRPRRAPLLHRPRRSPPRPPRLRWHGRGPHRPRRPPRLRVHGRPLLQARVRPRPRPLREDSTDPQRRRLLRRLVWHPAWRSASCRRRPLRRLIWRPAWRFAWCSQHPRRRGHRLHGGALRSDTEADDALHAEHFTERLDDALYPTLPDFGLARLGLVSDPTSVPAWGDTAPTPTATSGAEVSIAPPRLSGSVRIFTSHKHAQVALGAVGARAGCRARLPFTSTLFAHAMGSASWSAIAAVAVLSAVEVTRDTKDLGWRECPVGSLLCIRAVMRLPAATAAKASIPMAEQDTREDAEVPSTMHIREDVFRLCWLALLFPCCTTGQGNFNLCNSCSPCASRFMRTCS